ncbi:MAG: TetR/AcrR family transcriptional regulator [Saprospiraceae bacterium]
MEIRSKSDEKKESVLRAASEVFARYGFDKTTLEDIGKRAGLNKASLYYYFKNKEDIFIAVVLADTQAFLTDLQAKTLAYPDVRKQVRFFLTERIRRYGEVLHLSQLSVDNLHRLKPVLDELYQETKAGELAFLVSLLRRASSDEVLSIHLPSAVLAEHLFYLSEALKQGVLSNATTLQAGKIDFTPAIEQMEFWLKSILR